MPANGPGQVLSLCVAIVAPRRHRLVGPRVALVQPAVALQVLARLAAAVVVARVAALRAPVGVVVHAALAFRRARHAFCYFIPRRRQMKQWRYLLSIGKPQRTQLLGIAAPLVARPVSIARHTSTT